jgi:hypothetical protein
VEKDHLVSAPFSTFPFSFPPLSKTDQNHFRRRRRCYCQPLSTTLVTPHYQFASPTILSIMFGSSSSSIIGNDILDIGSRKFDHRDGADDMNMIPYAPPSLLLDSLNEHDRFEVPNVTDVR